MNITSIKARLYRDCLFEINPRGGFVNRYYGLPSF